MHCNIVQFPVLDCEIVQFSVLSAIKAYNGYQPCNKVLWINSAANITFLVITPETAGFEPLTPGKGGKSSYHSAVRLGFQYCTVILSSLLYCTAIWCFFLMNYNIVWLTLLHGEIVQFTVMHCNILWFTVLHCHIVLFTEVHFDIYFSLFQCTLIQ